MAKTKAIGIDLGTTNSAVAWVDESGRSAMVPNAEGELLTPSVVLFDDAEVIVGKEARNATIVNPERVAVWVKRDMGAPIYNRPIRGEYLPPEVIQACILRKLKADIVRALGPESRVVITVPAYFDEPRRKATADAGDMAGLDVLDIVNEPTAGALAFGEVLGYLSPQGAPEEEMTLMVYDLGGGTFDATLLKLAPGSVQTIATDGDVQLGGYDWDLRMVNYVADSFKKTYGIDPREHQATMSRLFNAVLDAKHALSARTHAPIRLDHAGSSLEIQVTRQQFEEMTADLLERTAYTTRQLLAAARLQWSGVSRILLVGGSTRMPMVPRMLQQLTGIVPDHTVNPDEAVARGAALYANYLLAKQNAAGLTPAFHVTNVNAHSLGVEGIDQDTLRKTNVILIPRNTPLPAKCTERFATKSEGQRSIVIQVLEGESSLPGECTAIGRTVIHDLPPGLPKGWPVEVTFEYGTNGRLSVRAAVPGTDREVTLDMERDVGLSHDGIARWKHAVSSSGGFEAFESTLLEVLNLPAIPSAGTPGKRENQASDWIAPGDGNRAARSQATAGAPGAFPVGPAPLEPAAATQPMAPAPGARQSQTASLGAGAAATGSPGAGSLRQPIAGGPAQQRAQGVVGARAAAGGQLSVPAQPSPVRRQAPDESPDAPDTDVVFQPVRSDQDAPPGRDASRSVTSLSGWIIIITGHVLAVAMGLGAGYLILAKLKPESFPWPW